MTAADRLFFFGTGYSARALHRRLDGAGWRFAGTWRAADGDGALRALGIDPVRFDGDGPVSDPAAFAGATHVLLSIPPDADGDPVLRHHAGDLAAVAGLRWVGYLSTTGVYGDRDGDWVDETSDLRPTGPRSRRRVAAEEAWRRWGDEHRIAVNVFRLAGIYGPGRSALDQVRAGTARRVVRPGHLFSRIHVDDIARVLAASIAAPPDAAGRGAIYNVCDDEPAAPAEVTAFACRLLGVDPPPEIPFETAEMSDMARSFWADNRRVRNDRIKRDLGVALSYPDYRAGLRAIAASG